MKRITERTLIEFEAVDRRDVEKMFNKSSIIHEELVRMSRLFTVGDWNPDTGEWEVVATKHPVMSRQKALDDLSKIAKHAKELADMAADFRTKVLDS